MDSVLPDVAQHVGATSVHITADADAALSQLTAEEQEQVHNLLRVLAEAGIPAGGNGIAQRLRGDEPLYLIRVPGAPDVRLFVSAGSANGRPLVVEDVARPENLRKMFKAGNV